jgi:hypothetical protein
MDAVMAAILRFWLLKKIKKEGMTSVKHNVFVHIISLIFRERARIIGGILYILLFPALIPHQKGNFRAK